MVIYRIDFYLPPYEFKIGLYVNFEKLFPLCFYLFFMYMDPWFNLSFQ